MNRILHILRQFNRMAAVVLIFSLSFSAVQTMSGTVVQAAQKKITLNRTHAVMTTGTTMQLKLKNLPKGKKVQWTSSNKKVATVSGKGKVTAKKTGIAEIIATVGKKQYTCWVKVKGNPIIPPAPSESSLNASEVAALKKLIEEQRMLGSMMSENVTDSDFYVWNSDGSLESLAVNLRGAVSLQDFPALVSLYTGVLDGEYHDESEKGLLTALDVTKNPALEILVCCDNRLTELDVTENPALKALNCYGNQLTTLDVTNNPALTLLSCRNNRLTELDVTKNTALDSLECYSNQLTELDITKNPALETLSCGANRLSVLDVANNPALMWFSCDDNKLTNLDVTNKPRLKLLSCNNNQLTDLDVTKNQKLQYLKCNHNQLTDLNVTKNPALLDLICSNNKLTGLDVTKNPKLRELSCDNNQLPSLNVKKNPALTILHCEGNKLKALNLKKNLLLDEFTCDNTVKVTK